MKEVMAIVRLNKVSATKQALAEAGFPSFTCRKVMGRGKKMIDPTVVAAILESGQLPVTTFGENITESYRLIPKRVFTLIVQNEDVSKIVDTLIDTNSTGNPGDGKIFVLPVMESYRVRNGEQQQDSEAY